MLSDSWGWASSSLLWAFWVKGLHGIALENETEGGAVVSLCWAWMLLDDLSTQAAFLEGDGPVVYLSQLSIGK